ncbi:MAG: bifunctional nuclease family protein [Candidatus Nezhaarchaeota archaeon]|nr:bifunctional nuclease family protein [Candidatus Nezhaarchaeota archaeon]
MKEFVEVKVLDVVTASTPFGLASAVLLEEPSGRLMPVLVDPLQASSIKEALSETAEGVGIHDLVVRLMKEADVSLKQAAIYAITEDRFKARITIETAKGNRDLESRASDAIALALRTKAPIYVASDVLSEASIEREALRASDLGEAP